MATAKRDLTNPPVQGPHRSQRRDDQVLTLQQVAELLQVSEQTIYYWRYQGTGPKGHKVGKRVRYWRSDIIAWMDEHADIRFESPVRLGLGDRGGSRRRR